MERVVVTGCGVASPLGCTLDEFWKGLLEGVSGVVALEDEEFARLPTRIGARVTGFKEEDYFDRKEMRRMSRSSHLALVAATEAVASAGLMSEGVSRAEIGVLVGSSIGGYSASDHFFRDYYLHDQRSPLIIPVSMNIGPSSNISIRYGFLGPLVSIDAACASAAQSLGYAFNLLRSGVLQIAVAGGADSPFSSGVVASWCALRALSERNDDPAHACRPFSADRDGMVLGEGAGVLVLETESSALRRDAAILGEIKGYGATSDGFHLTQPAQDGPARAMRAALDSAGLQPEDIDCINAHATATRLNDGNETSAIKRVFSSRAYEIPVVGNKAAIGHSIAASGALELISCLLTLRDREVPPTINYTGKDPECDLDYVTEGRRPHKARNIISNSFAFGGSNASLVVGEYSPR